MCPSIAAVSRVLFFALGVLCFVSCEGRDSRSTRVIGEIGANGGQVVVTAGPLAGTVLTVPPDALPEVTAIRVDQSLTPELVGLEPIGPGAAFNAPMQLEADARARLVFDPALLPIGATGGQIAVVQQTSAGRQLTINPFNVDLVNGTVDVAVPTFASYWVVRVTVDIDFVLANYFPLLDGDTFTYDNGFTLDVDLVSNEPNLEGLFVSRATFSDGLEDFGLYLVRDFTETLLLGEFSRSRDFQVVTVPSLMWLAESGRPGDSMADLGSGVLYEPFGSPLPTDVLEVRLRVSIASQGRLSTPLGRFESVLELVFETQRTDLNLNVETTVDRLWLARGVGPVRIEIERPTGRTTGSIVSGAVGGFPVVAQ